jgi:hypothetical protein
MTSALALFGRGSWLSTAATYVSDGTYNLHDHSNDKKLSWQLFCRGMPFSKLWAPLDIGFLDSLGKDFVSLYGSLDQIMFDGYEPEDEDLLQATHHFLTAFAPVGVASDSKERTLNNPEILLNTAMFVANRAFLTLLSPEVSLYREKDLTGRLIYTSSVSPCKSLSVQRQHSSYSRF